MNSNSYDSLTLNRVETISVYLLLKTDENKLDPIRLRLLSRLEKRLYKELSIEEFESLNELYHKVIEFSRRED